MSVSVSAWEVALFKLKFLLRRNTHPSLVQVKFKGKQTNKQTKKVVIVFLGLNDFGGFKGRREMTRFQVVPFAISANFAFNLSVKVYAGQNPYKNGEFFFFLARKTQ